MQTNAPLRFSRSCGICSSDSPHRRVVYVACGHLACRACAEQMKGSHRAWAFPCPFCRSSGGLARLVEDLQTTHNCLTFDENEKRCNADIDRIDTYTAAVTDIHATVSRMKEVRQGLEVDVELAKSQMDIALTARNAAEGADRRQVAQTAYESSQVAVIAALNEANSTDKRIIMHLEALNGMCATLSQIRPPEVVDALIANLRTENEASATLGLCYSRACSGCDETSGRRVFYSTCGCAVCRECAEKWNQAALEEECPACCTQGSFIPLYEDLSEEINTSNI